LNHDKWRRLIEESTPESSPVVIAMTFLKAWPSYSKPVLLSCDDEQQYVVKGRHNGRAIVNERVVGILGAVLGAPVADVALVQVSSELIEIEPNLSHMEAGVSHGSRLIPGCSNDREPIKQVDMSTNRDRFASLAVLYGWVGANDHQVIYRNQSPRSVFSFDHGHFFPNGPNWSAESLATAAKAEPDATVTLQSGLEVADVRRPIERLSQVANETIAAAVADVPVDWDFPSEDRIVVAQYLAGRRDELSTWIAGL
jgi:hypothetical protein